MLIYAGADGHASLYEDQGTDYGYEHGHYSRVPIRYDDATGMVAFGQREGDGSGAPATRQFVIRRIDAAHPDADAADASRDQSVTYRGHPLNVPR